MSGAPERFDLLLQEKLDQLDQAAEQEAMLAVDEVEQLRLQAAHLVSHTAGGPWATGAPVQFQQNPAEQVTAPPTLDIRFPARPLPAAAGKSGVESSVGRQGRRVP
jgi:hypothetical protein